MSVIVSQELSVIMGVMIPLVLLFIAFVPVIIEVLYTGDFQVIRPMVYMGIIGTVLRALSSVMAYVMLAKADGTVYMAVEVASAAVYVGASIMCFNLWGIPGMGMAYIIWYAVYTLMVAIVYRRRYGLWLSPSVVRLSLLAFGASVVGCVMVMATGDSVAAHVVVGTVGFMTAAVILPGILWRRKNNVKVK